jgi:hypothetical protein
MKLSFLVQLSSKKESSYIHLLSNVLAIIIFLRCAHTFPFCSCVIYKKYCKKLSLLLLTRINDSVLVPALSRSQWIYKYYLFHKCQLTFSDKRKQVSE